MNNYQIIINQFTQSNFNLVFTGKVSLNPTLRHIGGRYLKDTNTIELSPRVTQASYINSDVFNKLLWHEGLHWVLHQLGLPYGDTLPEFETYLQQFKLITSDPKANNYGAIKKVLLCYEQGTVYLNPDTGTLIRAKIPTLGGYKIFSHEQYNKPLISEYSQRIPLRVTQYV